MLGLWVPPSSKLHAFDDAKALNLVPPWRARVALEEMPAALRALRDEAVVDIENLVRLEGIYDSYSRWSDQTNTSTVICHGDLHPGNVVMTQVGPFLVDWEGVCLAPACFDHAMLTTLKL